MKRLCALANPSLTSPSSNALLRTVLLPLLVHLAVRLLLAPSYAAAAAADSISAADTQAITVAIRIQRDLSLSLPINRGAGPGLVLNSSVLAKNYTLDEFQLTETLLSTLVRRVVFDIYWNNGAKVFQMCPERYPAGGVSPAAGATSVLLGDSECSATPLTIGDITALVPGWLASGQGGEYLNTVVVLVLNIHDLGIPENSTAGGTTTTFANLSQIVLSPRLYTPKMLAAFRASIDNSTSTSSGGGSSSSSGSGSDSSTSRITTSPYYSVNKTNDAWPRGAELVAKSTQIIFAFGSSDLTNSSGYDTSYDADVIFSMDAVAGVAPIATSALSFSPSGGMSSCAAPGANIRMAGTAPFEIGNPTYQGAAAAGATSVSWSWPYVEDGPAAPFAPAMVESLVGCGFQPLFNTKFSVLLLNASVWSWASGEPASTTNGKSCAFMRMETGRWSADNCKDTYPVACQLMSSNPASSNPYNWTISPTSSTFALAADACTPPYTFSVPKTAQENFALASTLRALQIPRVWINLNRVQATCWVEGYQARCPYTVTDNSYRAFIGATLKQGIVIVIVFALFVIFKIRRQLRVSRQSRRKADVRRKLRNAQLARSIAA
ncbi:Maintenance of telomere capping protein 6 [Geranomyces variabilis]|nr:Maintenance of telomere capping protein 6 [Geranomyces variabilis]